MKRTLWFKIVLAAVLVNCFVGLTQVHGQITFAHPVYGNVLNSNGSIPETNAISFAAYIAARPGEILTQNSLDCSVATALDGNTQYLVECGTFPTAWQSGDVLVISLNNSANGESAVTNVVLTNSVSIPFQQVNVRLTAVSGAPTISFHPQSITTNAGAVVSFGVVATGTGTLSYQWQNNQADLANGGRLSGVNSSTLTISDVQGSDAGIYRVVVSNEVSHAVSSNATLTVVVAPPSTRNIALSGNLAFGGVAVGNTANRTFTITNSGNAALTVSNITYPPRFSGVWSGGRIPAGMSTNVLVTFAPTNTTSYSDNVVVVSDATSGINTLPISGNGVVTPTRVIAVSGDLAFGDVAVGSSSNRVITISNTGNATLTITNITKPGGFAVSWSVAQLASGGSTNLTVTFSPTTATSYSGTVVVLSDKTSGTNSVSVSGGGIVIPTRIISLSGNLAFGGVIIGDTATRTLTISNSGNASLTIANISYPAGFEGNWSGTLAAGSSTNVTVVFTPVSATQYGGNLTVNSDATSGVNLVALTGEGVAPLDPPVLQALLLPTASNFTNLMYRQTALLEAVVRVTNPNTDNSTAGRTSLATASLPSSGPAVRIWIRNLTNGVQVFNATGSSNGVPYILYNWPLAPGDSVDLHLEFYVTDRRTVPNPTLTAEWVSVAAPFTPSGTILGADRILRLTNWTYTYYLVDFGSVVGKTYYVQYTDDLTSWHTALPGRSGTGTRIQWVDNGPPKTRIPPGSVTDRFYRIISVP